MVSFFIYYIIDISVLENYHIAQSFKVLSKKSFNIFKNFSPEEYRICRRRMIEGIIATDMANHQKVLSATKTKVELYDIVKGKNFEKILNDDEVANNLVKVFDSQQCILNMIIHVLWDLKKDVFSMILLYMDVEL